MEQLIILGTGVHAAEMAEIVERINQVTPTWELLGYLTTDAVKVGTPFNGYPVLGKAEDVSLYLNAYFVPDNDWPHHPGPWDERLTSIIDPGSFISKAASIGKGCVIYPNSYVGLNAKLGTRVFCLSGCIINHDDWLGDRVVLASGVVLAGSVTVESDCYLGQSCSVRQFVTISAGSLIGMGSVVVKDVPPKSVMVGNPAKKLRDR